MSKLRIQLIGTTESFDKLRALKFLRDECEMTLREANSAIRNVLSDKTVELNEVYYDQATADSAIETLAENGFTCSLVNLRKIYITDEETGLSPETSHPNFKKIAEDFFYSCTDEFSPFGNDSGNDVLSMLEEYFTEGNWFPIKYFFDGVVQSWGLPVPKDMKDLTKRKLNNWLAKDEYHETYLFADLQMRIAMAFAELKICGRIDYFIKQQAFLAFKLMRLMDLSEEYLERINIMENALNSCGQ